MRCQGTGRGKGWERAGYAEGPSLLFKLGAYVSLLTKTSMLLQRPAQTQNCAGSVGARPRPGRARVVPRRCSPPTLASTTPRLLPCEWGQRSQECHRQGTLHCWGMPESLCPPCPGGGPLSTVLRSDTCGHGSPGPGDLSGQCPRLSLTLWCPGGGPHTLRAGCSLHTGAGRENAGSALPRVHPSCHHPSCGLAEERRWQRKGPEQGPFLGEPHESQFGAHPEPQGEAGPAMQDGPGQCGPSPDRDSAAEAQRETLPGCSSSTPDTTAPLGKPVGDSMSTEAGQQGQEHGGRRQGDPESSSEAAAGGGPPGASA